MEILTDSTKENGVKWLFELMYGAEKSFLLSRYVQYQKPRELVLNSDAQKLAYKINNTVDNLDTFLLGKQVTICPITNEYGSITGILSGYDLDHSVIALGRGVNKVRINFAKIELDGSTIKSSKLILLETNQPYKY